MGTQTPNFFRKGKHSVPVTNGSRHFVDVIAHRGGKEEWPEETSFAFEQAIDAGVDVLEMDVRATSDDHLVLMHNSTVNATTDGCGFVRRFSLAQIQRLDAAHIWRNRGHTPVLAGQKVGVPTLKEVFQQFSGTRMNIEIKGWHPIRAKKIAKLFCDLITQYGMADHVLVASFHKPVLRHVRDKIRRIAISPSLLDVLKFTIASKLNIDVFTPTSRVVQTSHKVIDRKMVLLAHSKELIIHAFTVNEEEDMRRLINLGVDGIITDYPTTLIKVLTNHPAIPAPY